MEKQNLTAKNGNGTQKSFCSDFYIHIFGQSKYTGHFIIILMNRKGESPNEQPFLAVYKLRLASANAMASPLSRGIMSPKWFKIGQKHSNLLKVNRQPIFL